MWYQAVTFSEDSISGSPTTGVIQGKQDAHVIEFWVGDRGNQICSCTSRRALGGHQQTEREHRWPGKTQKRNRNEL